MLTTYRHLLGSSSAVRHRVIGVYVFLALFNVLAWTLAIASSAAYSIMLPTAFLAYTFGLGTRSMPTTSRPSTTRPASSCRMGSGPSRSASSSRSAIRRSSSR